LDWLHGALAVFLKDARLELRTRFALNALGLFVAAAVFLLRFALGDGPVAAPVAAALLWVVILFAATVGLGRAFVVEEERGTVLLLQLTLRPSAVYGGKLLFNAALQLALNGAAALLFLVLVAPPVAAPGLLTATLALGALGLAGATTLLSAVIARTASSGPLLAVLAFPVLVPLLFSAVRATRLAFEPGAAGAAWIEAQADLTALVGYAGLAVTASFLLFDYVWRD
jgi:heme exporter protein B